MAVKVIASFSVLMSAAHAVGAARKSGDKEALQKAKVELAFYEEICLNADEVNLEVINKQLIGRGSLK